MQEGASVSTQSFESLSTNIAVASSLFAKIKTYLMAFASAWRGRLVYTLLAQANTTSPLQSLATTAMEEPPSLKVASTFILIESLGGVFSTFVLVLAVGRLNGLPRTFYAQLWSYQLSDRAQED